MFSVDNLITSQLITLVQTEITNKLIRWIAVTFGSDIHVPLSMNCNFRDHLTLHLAFS